MKFIVLSAALLLGACNGGRADSPGGESAADGGQPASSEAEQLFQHFNQFADGPS